MSAVDPGADADAARVDGAVDAARVDAALIDADAAPADAAAEAARASRVVTVPNAISVARLVGVPVFLYLLLGPHADVAALVVLILAGISDWADGVLARRLNQYSRLGELLDPAADRLYILATLVGLVLRDIIPWWLAAIIVGRDLILAGALAVLRRYGYGPLPVHYLGKAATFNLLYAFPFLLLAVHVDAVSPVAWAFTLWGTGLYLWAGGLYLLHVSQVVASVRRGEIAGAGARDNRGERSPATEQRSERSDEPSREEQEET